MIMDLRKLPKRLWILLMAVSLVVILILLNATHTINFEQFTVIDDTNVKILAKDQSVLKHLSDDASKLFEVAQTSLFSGQTDTVYNDEVSDNVSSRYGTCHHGQRSVRLTAKPELYKYFTEDYTMDKEPAKSALSEAIAKRYCGGNIVDYGGRMSILHDVIMFPKARNDPGSIGGEQVVKVLHQQVDKEHLQFKNGFLNINCFKNRSDFPQTGFKDKFLRTMQFEASHIKPEHMEINEQYVIAIERGDYANLHNWARGIFNTFLVMIKFKIQPSQMQVLFLDAHPFSSLDHAWEEIFGPIKRIGHLQNPVLYKNLIFTFKESDGPVSDFHHRSIGETEEYRDFVLSRHRINSNGARLICPRIKITIIIRRNAVYHPRNVEGRVGRKIFNEAEVVEALLTAFPHACVQAIMMEALPFHLQLEVISQTDLLIGMHGAGMSHTMILPQHAAVLELFPVGFKKGRPWFECFEAVARWRGLKYDSWENFDLSIEMPHDYTILPADIVVQKTRGLVDQLCK